MPVVISAKTSTDAGNLVTLGSDGGLYAPTRDRGEANPTYLIDNSLANAGGAFNYPLGVPEGGNPIALAANIGVLQPFMLRKAGAITGINVSVSTSGPVVYFTLYAPNPATGYPTSKVVDLGGQTAASGTILNPGITAAALSPFVMYWLAIHVSASVTFTQRAAYNHLLMRQSAMPADISAAVGVAVHDNTSAWGTMTGPATVTPITTVQTAATTPVAVTPPMVWLAITNS